MRAKASEAKDSGRPVDHLLQRRAAAARTHAPNARAGTGNRSPRANYLWAAAYFALASCGVNPMIWTPAPRATSMASTTSWYSRLAPALMNRSLAGRWS